jgi:hypothetical protein
MVQKIKQICVQNLPSVMEFHADSLFRYLLIPLFDIETLLGGGGGENNHRSGILIKSSGNEKPQRSVVIDDEDIDAYSADYGDENEDDDLDEELGDDDDARLIDEEEARLRCVITS